MSILFIIATAKNGLMEDAFNEFGEQNMLPRLNTAIKLTKAAGWPKDLVKRLERIRLELQREGGRLAERRNLFVHGVHAAGERLGETAMTMVRWKGDNRRHVVTALDAAKLANQLSLLSQEVERISGDYAVWKFGIEYQTKGNQQIAQTKAALRFVRAQNIKRAIKLLVANLKPW